MSDRFTGLLSDYLDHDLPRSEGEALERHLEACAECRDVLAGLAAVKTRAVVLELPRRSRAWAMPQWALAAAAFAVVAAGAIWFAQDRLANRGGEAGVAVRDSAPGGTDASSAGLEADRIEQEIHDLQAALERGRGKLAPETVQVLEDNLRTIHKALDDARTALEQDPANRELRDYLASSVQRKLELMRRAAVLAGV